MNTTLSMKMREHAPSVLRWGMAGIFLWFGLQQLIDAASFVGYVPDSIVSMSHLSVVTIVHLNGVFELVLGFLLLIGLYTRVSSGLLALHMLDITYVVGYDAIGVRDLGLAIASIAVFMHGADEWGVDHLREAGRASARRAADRMRQAGSSVRSAAGPMLALLLMLSCASAAVPQPASAASVVVQKAAAAIKTIKKPAAKAVKAAVKKAAIKTARKVVRKVASVKKRANGTSPLLNAPLIDPNNPPGGRY